MLIPPAAPRKAPTRPRKKKPKALTATIQPVVRPHAAGIDVGATAMYVAVPSDADACPVRARQRQRREQRLRAPAAQCGFELTPLKTA